MADWADFEQNSAAFLNENSPEPCLKFKATGGSDSTQPDIQPLIHGKPTLENIEAKLTPSQAGQFVVLLKDGKFQYSSTYPPDEFSSKIIDEMNQNLEEYSECGTKGVEVMVNQEVLVSWIRQHYANKNSKFIATSTKSGNFDANWISVIPIERLGEFFQVSAVARRKKSGSRHLPRKDLELVQRLVEGTYGPNHIVYRDGQIEFAEGFELQERYFGEGQYFVSGKNQIKKLSKTNNISVIFTLDYIGEHTTTGFDELYDYFLESL